MKASLNNYRHAPRKVRLVTDLIKGKSVTQADALLSNLVKKASSPIKKLIDSAAANAGVAKDDLYIKNITVTKGVVLKRWMPRAFGRAYPIKKHTSKVTVTLEEKQNKATKTKKKVS